MMKRPFSLLLAVAVLCCCMTVTVGATESPDAFGLVNLLELATPNNSDSFVVSVPKGGTTLTFDLPYTTSVRYVDLFITAPADLSGVAVYNGSSYDTLTVERVSTYNYRVYGSVSASKLAQIKVKFDSVTGGAVTFYSFLFSPTGYAFYSSPSTLTLSGTGVSNMVLEQSAGDSSVVGSIEVGQSQQLLGDYVLYIENDDWQKYDYLTLTFMIHAVNLNSLKVTVGDAAVPYTVSYIEASVDDNAYFDEVNRIGSNRTYFDVTLTADLTSAKRTSTDDLSVVIMGTSDVLSAALYYSYGYIEADLPSAEVTWLQKIWKGLEDGFQSVVNAITGDTSASDEFNDEIQEEVDELEKSQEVIESMTTPDLEVIVGDINLNRDAADGFLFIGNIFNALWSSPLSMVFLYSGIFALVAYLLYGRR